MSEVITAEELFQNGNSEYCELVEGRVVDMLPGGGMHGRYTSRIDRIAGAYIEDHNLGESFGAETGFILKRNPDTVRAPDFAFIAKERLHLIEKFDEFLSIPPDLAVEVVSPSDRWTKIEEKVNDYIQAGVRLVWVINPSTKIIHVYRGFAAVSVLTTTDTLEGGEVLPGFSISAAKIFA